MKVQSGQHGKEHRRRLRGWRRMMLWIGLGAAAFGLGKLIGYGTDYFSSRQTTRELREIAEKTDAAETDAPLSRTEQPAPEAASSPAGSVSPPEEARALPDALPEIEYPNGYNLVPRIRKLRKKSEYIIGWIAMDNLDEPVVRKDNTFFLDHDAMAKKNRNGAIFMDQGISLLTRPYTILLYGHNMKTGAMFGSLRKYEDFSYCWRHRVFRFDTLYEEGQYVIFAVETIRLTPGLTGTVNLTELQSTDRNTRRNALKALTDHSLHDMMLDVNEEDQLLLLITCVGEDDERLIVAARRLRDGEVFQAAGSSR